MELELRGRRAFISGSTQGIGRAIARSLLQEGVEVVINGRTDTGVSAAVDSLAAEIPGAVVSGLAADFADADSVHRLLARLGHVDILVNNVGLFEVAPFADITDEQWQRYFTVNLMSGVRLSRHVLGSQLEAGWGRIVFVSSESGVNVPGDMTHYGVTKAGMLALGNGLAKLTRGTGVTVNTVLGGPTWSDGVADSVQQIADQQGVRADDLRKAIIGATTTSLVERFLDPDEIASLVTYLASPRASATNGAALRADGGVLTGML